MAWPCSTAGGGAASPRRWSTGRGRTSPEADWAWTAVVLVEASPVECRVRLEFAAPAELRALAVLPTPVGDLLREDPPDR